MAGHEYCAGEDHDKALSCYRTAVRLDPRHYNAMFGVGQVYLKQVWTVWETAFGVWGGAQRVEPPARFGDLATKV